jgi:hypothetical protein
VMRSNFFQHYVHTRLRWVAAQDRRRRRDPIALPRNLVR